MIGFVVAMIGRDHFGWHLWLPVSLRRFYFEFAMLMPILAIIVAFSCDLFFNRERLDWWTYWAVSAIMLGLGTAVVVSLSL